MNIDDTDDEDDDFDDFDLGAAEGNPYGSQYTRPYGCYPPYGFPRPNNSDITTELLKALLLAQKRETDTLKKGHDEISKLREEMRMASCIHESAMREKDAEINRLMAQLQRR